MKRYTALRILSSCLEDNDVALFSGKGVCAEAFKYHRPGNFYLNEVKSPAAVAIGLANGTDKRVFIFCEDYKLLEDLSAAGQMAVSKCNNIFYIVLVSGQYTSNMPTIFNSLIAPKGMLFNMGFIVHNYDSQFNITKSAKEIKAIWSTAKGPLAAFVSVAGSSETFNAVENDVTKFSEFVKDVSIGSSMSQRSLPFDNITLIGE